MNPATFHRIGFLIASGALVASLALPDVARPAAADADAESLAFRPHPGDRLPLSTTFVDEQQRAVTLGDYFTSSPVILVLDYLRCTSLCGVTLRNLVTDALDRIPLEPGRDYQLVAISIDPRDKPADAAAARTQYADLLGRTGGVQGMHFLTTSSTTAVRDVAATVGFPYRYDGLLDAYIHPAGFVIAAPDGLISRYVEGVAISPQELVGALADAEQDKALSPLTRLILLCHEQVGRLGRFTVPVLTAFTLANIAALSAVIAIFTAIWRRRHG
jgi:protein SCO1/2